MTQVISTARVATDRPARYGKQLTSHMAKRCETTWDDEAGSGSITFADDAGRTSLACEPGALVLTLAAEPDHLERLEGVLGRHLVRFGRRDELVAEWARSDGTPGTRQENTEDEPAAH